MNHSSTTPPDDSERAVPSDAPLTKSPTPPATEPAREESSSSDLVIPPEEELTAPPEVPSPEENESDPAISDPASPWLVVALNRRVNRDWEALLVRAPENTRRCYRDLSTAPMVRKPRRVFPLKGKLYRGAWEYEVTSSDRVFYVPDAERQKVIVYYAGKHPKAAPTPP